MWGEYADLYAPQIRCDCSVKNRFRKWVGEAIYKAKDIKSSKLLGREGDNLFIASDRKSFLAHLKYVLLHHDFSFGWRAVTDVELLDIYLGKNETYTSVSSYAAGPELLVIHLGVLSYKNISMPGVILEALKTREHRELPTWVVNSGSSFSEGHLCWDNALEYYLDSNFHKLNFVTTKTGGQSSNSQSKKNPRLDNIDLI
jgi:hypothetical protein